MDKNMFFNFGSKLLSSTIQAHAVGIKRGENEANEHWKLIKGNYTGIESPITFKQAYGKKLTDILDTGWPSLLLISSRMKGILESHNLTGWKTFPLKLYDKNEVEVSGYYGFSVTGKCASINYGKSEIIEKRLVPTGPICKFYKGISIDVDKWDKSDFFAPEGSFSLFVTQKAAEILKKNKITNLRLEAVTEIEIDVDDVKQTTKQILGKN